jgi:NitT/TauT family transport system permease protein
MRIIKATPVASFIILALIWINSRNLSVLISFLMVVPVVYMNVLQGLHETDRKLLEMAKIFHITRRKMITSVYIPSVMPYLITSVTVGLGFCWKSGIAAEVIGRPSGSIGERLYEAKLYIMTKELFAWTFVIIIISVLFEKIVMLLLQLLKKDRVNHNS